VKSERGVILALLMLAAVTAVGAQERLPTVRVAGKSPCQSHPETAAETADLWIAAREALEAVSRESTAMPTLLVREWQRSLDQKFRLRWERFDTSRVTTLHPFEKAPPGSLEREGYIQQRGWTTWFYGPDSGLLLSEWFLRRHCFSRLDGTGATTGLLGLGFVPLPTTDRPDVTGVLWIDPARGNGELRFVEYAWTNAPPDARAPGVGGRAEFVRLHSAGGAWIVQRWNIRMPRPMLGFEPWIEGYTDKGGEVLAVTRKNP
jgi:hypothetical protein